MVFELQNYPIRKDPHVMSLDIDNMHARSPIHSSLFNFSSFYNSAEASWQRYAGESDKRDNNCGWDHRKVTLPAPPISIQTNHVNFFFFIS